MEISKNCRNYLDRLDNPYHTSFNLKKIFYSKTQIVSRTTSMIIYYCCAVKVAIADQKLKKMTELFFPKSHPDNPDRPD